MELNLKHVSSNKLLDMLKQDVAKERMVIFNELNYRLMFDRRLSKGYSKIALTCEKKFNREAAIKKCFRKNIVIELFGGTSQLTKMYRNHFKKVITVDKVYKADFMMDNMKFIKSHLNDIPFDLIDFDASGCPGKQIQEFFKVVKRKRFVLTFTDGSGLNFKIRGLFNLFKNFMYGEDENVITSNELNDKLGHIHLYMMDKLVSMYNYNYEFVNFTRSKNKNVLYGAYRIWK